MREYFKGLTAKTLFFGILATAILYNELVLRPGPRPLGILTAFFLYGLIPAFWGDHNLPSIAAMLRGMADVINKQPPPPPPNVKPKEETPSSEI